MIHLTAAEGVHRVEDAYVNWYVVERGSVAEAVALVRAAGPS
jgi:hypothetical protein